MNVDDYILLVDFTFIDLGIIRSWVDYFESILLSANCLISFLRNIDSWLAVIVFECLNLRICFLMNLITIFNPLGEVIHCFHNIVMPSSWWRVYHANDIRCPTYECSWFDSYIEFIRRHMLDWTKLLMFLVSFYIINLWLCLVNESHKSW